MIRLTEIEQIDPSIKIKLEGDLTESTLAIFAQALIDYHQRDLRAIHIDAEGLLRIDQPALEQARLHFPAELHLVFHTSRPTLQHQLKNCGFITV